MNFLPLALFFWMLSLSSEYSAFRPPPPYFLRARDKTLDLSRPVIMGILNLSADSFYAGSRVTGEDLLLKKAESMLEEGAEILDLGALSSRPGSIEISEREEINLLIPAVRTLRKSFPNKLISADVYRTGVAEAVLSEGVDIINNIGGSQANDSFLKTIAAHQAGCILMHSRGSFPEMHQHQSYESVITEVAGELKQSIYRAEQAGIVDIIADPGFGFSKNPEQNFLLFRDLKYLQNLNCPLLIGISRKSMIYRSLDCGPEEALNGSTALHMAALMQGVHILRVHDVKPAKEVLTLFNKLCLPG